ncbi:bacteriocin immunity protein [Streptococcus sp. sy010]|uniref:bacteriocin immunity protein n=1 Tax=Streptococcus sp. sy010 TaxID=2600148 RepID=UPI0011B3FF9E|nr:bacteriocin immunity protein [Streptococcus sp. sy010]TWT16346.1 bacteriocin immunity protein [Streptococcus sp. sy010]
MADYYDDLFLKVLQDPAVQEKEELYQLFLTSYSEYQKKKDDAIMLSLTSKVSLYLLTHRYEAPKSVIDFAQKFQKSLHQERGKARGLLQVAFSLFNQ